jgi:hypothetical protein
MPLTARAAKNKSPKRRSAVVDANPNHHLWQHGKNWWVYCAVNPTPRTKDKLRRSLSTECVETARFRRDELFRRLQAEGMLGRIRALSQPSRTTTTSQTAAEPGVKWQDRADAILAVVMSMTPDVKPASSRSKRTRRKLDACCS